MLNEELRLIPIPTTRPITHNPPSPRQGFTPPRRIRAGFTLVELLVALAIISLLGGLGFANYRAFSQRQLLAQAARELRSDLRLAANLVLTGEKPGVCSGGTLSGYRVNFSGAKTYLVEARCDVSGSQESETVKTVNLPGTSTEVIFNPIPSPILFKVVGQGTDVVGTATITLSGFGQTESVTVNAAGGVE